MFFKDRGPHPDMYDSVQCFEKVQTWFQRQKDLSGGSVHRQALGRGPASETRVLLWPVLSTYVWWSPGQPLGPGMGHPVRAVCPELSLLSITPPVLAFLLCDSPTQMGGGLGKSAGVCLPG